MSGKREVTVLCPNGRRVRIKTESSTSIGQIIEEASTKHNLNPLDYNLKHIKRVLDPSNSLQYANVPTHAQLELISTLERRLEGRVTLQIISESGERILHEFSSNSTLWDILFYFSDKGIHIPEDGADKEPILIYMMKKFSGTKLKTTTLKSLGLYSGNVIMRYNIQEKFKNSNPQVVINVPKKVEKKIEDVEMITKTESLDNTVVQSKSSWMEEDSIGFHGEKFTASSKNHSATATVTNEKTFPINSTLKSPHVKCKEFESSDEDIDMEVQIDRKDQGIANEVKSENPSNIRIKSIQPILDDFKTIYLNGERKALLFNVSEAVGPCTYDDETDEFFEVTTDDLKKLHKEQIQEMKDLTERPLETLKMRKMEKSSQLLSAMNKFPTIQIRVQFPDQNVIQANFKPQNTVKNVQDFVRPFLRNPSMDFFLYTLFPRTNLNPANTLAEAGCVPKARLYFSPSENYETDQSFLSDETLAQKSSFSAASNAVFTNQRNKSDKAVASDKFKSLDGKSSNEQQIKRTNDNIKNDKDIKPKWFKLGK